MTATPATITAASPAAGYVATLAPATRPGAVASLTRAAKLAAGHDYADGTRPPLAPPAGRHASEGARRSPGRVRAGDRQSVACRDPGRASGGMAGWKPRPRRLQPPGGRAQVGSGFARSGPGAHSRPGPGPVRRLRRRSQPGGRGEGRRANGGLVRSWPPEGRSASDSGRRPGPGRRDAHRPGQGWPGQAGLYRRERGRRRYRGMAQDPGRPRRPVVRARESGGAGQRRGNEPPGNQRAGGHSGPASRIGRPPGVPRPAAIVS